MLRQRLLLELEPLDTLFFRDARPMQSDAGSGGHGARWPLPTVVHEAFRTALLRRSGELPRARAQRGHHHPNTSGERWIATRAFESLRLLGPFPVHDSTLFLPVPGDVVPASSGQVATLAPLPAPGGVSNLPAPWLRSAGAVAVPSKEEPPPWISSSNFARLIGLEPGSQATAPEPVHLWDSEHRIGVEIDPVQRAAKEGQLYAAEHLRPRPGLRIWLSLELSPTETEKASELLQLEGLLDDLVTLGGESRLCRVARSSIELAVPTPKMRRSRGKGVYGIRWVLTTPAVFAGGWRPGWVSAEKGEVELRRANPRLPGETRLEWRKRMDDSPRLEARLVAVCSGKPLAFSGWEMLAPGLQEAAAGAEPLGPGPKPTQLAVPAGSVYYFEADSREAAESLIEALHGRTRSDRFGEKGMGLGFCGSWEPLDLPFLN